MAYLTINGTDFSNICGALKVTTRNIYNSQTNAAGNTVVDYINNKISLEVSIIPVDDSTMEDFLEALSFNSTIGFRNPATGFIQTINCIYGKRAIEYYTIQVDNVSFKGCKITFEQL
jgi:hypothetical protein